MHPITLTTGKVPYLFTLVLAAKIETANVGPAVKDGVADLQVVQTVGDHLYGR